VLSSCRPSHRYLFYLEEKKECGILLQTVPDSVQVLYLLVLSPLKKMYFYFRKLDNVGLGNLWKK